MTDRNPSPAAAGKAPRPSSAESDRAESDARVLVVTGMSGAGKSSALKALEDQGYEAVDNVPLSLLAGLVRPDEGFRQPLAIGVDTRTRDFGVAPVLEAMGRLRAGSGIDARLLFVDCSDETLRRRFTETRRRHPLALDRPVTDGIRHEREFLAPLRQRADLVIDTTGYTLADLHRDLDIHFAVDTAPGLSLFVTSFSYRHGIPREADLVFDVRFLANPHYEPTLRPLSGLDKAVGDYIEADRDFESFFSGLTSMLQPLLPRFHAEGRSYLTIAVGCTGGRHRSVYVAAKLAEWLRGQGLRVSNHHRDVARGSPRD